MLSTALKTILVYEWYKWFKRGEMSIENTQRPSRSSTSKTDGNVKKIRPIVYDYKRLLINPLNGLVFSFEAIVGGFSVQMTRLVAKLRRK